MSPLAKVFVVVNLILSVAFFGSSATLFATRVNWREKALDFEKKAKEELTNLKEKYESQGSRLVELNNQHKALNINFNSLTTEKAKIEGNLQETKTKLSAAEMRNETLHNTNLDLNKSIDNLKTNVTNLTTLVETLRKEADSAKTVAENATTQYSRIRVDLDSLNQEHSKTLIQLADVSGKLKTAQLQLENAKLSGIPIGPETVAPPIDAVVQAVDGEMVVLSVGQNQQVRMGYEFTVYRGNQFVGKVKVIKVYDDLSGAQILYTNQGEEVQAGDRAATQI